MFYHINCKGNVVVKVEEMCLGADNFSLDSRNGIVRISSMIVVYPKNMAKIPAKFYCTICDKYIEESEVAVSCNYCGHATSITKHYLIKRGGSTLCGSCKKKLISREEIKEEDCMQLMDLFEKGITPPQI